MMAMSPDEREAALAAMSPEERAETEKAMEAARLARMSPEATERFLPDCHVTRFSSSHVCMLLNCSTRHVDIVLMLDVIRQ